MDSKRLVIVAIDDYNDNLIAVKAFVTDSFPGAHVYTALNGKDGIELARKTDPDVILLDILMPGMDGFEVCNQLKRDPVLSHIPVIFLTALKDDPKSRIRALESGGEAFVSKPFEEAEFIAQIRAMVKIKAANIRELKEKETLFNLVTERTEQLERELADRKKAEIELRLANEILTQNRAAMLNLLSDLKEEVEARKKSESLLQTVLVNLDGIIFSIDNRGTFLVSEGKALSSLGLSGGKVVGQSVFEVYRQVPDIISAMKTALAGSPWSGVILVQDIFFDTHILPVFDEQQAVCGAVGIAVDISGQKRSEVTLRESEERYRKLVEHIPDYILVHNNGVIRFVNNAAATSFGYTSDELIGSHLMKYLTTESQQVVSEMMEKRFRGEDLPPYEITILTKEGERKITEVHGVSIQYEGELASLNVLTDITERKQVEDAQSFMLRSNYLQSGEDFFHSIARYLSTSLHMDYICIDRLEGDLLSARTVAVFFDGEFEDNITYTLKDTPCGKVVGQRICVFPNDVRNIFPKDTVLQEMGAESYIGTTLWGFDGAPIGLIACIGRKPLINSHLAESLLQQVAIRAAGELERTLAEQALRESEERHRAIVSAMPDIFFIINKDGEFLGCQAKDTSQLLLPPKKFIGRVLSEVIPGTVADLGMQAIRNTLKTGELQIFEYFLDMPLGRQWFEMRIVKSSSDIVLAILRDITGRKISEEALRESNQKLRLLTGLTRHDIFNQVSAVELLLDMALQTSDLNAIHTHLKSAKEAGNHIEATIGFTRDYENFGMVSSGWQHLYQIIEIAKTEVDILGFTLENQISLDLEIYADPIIRKVFTTLMDNSIRHGDKITSIRFFSNIRGNSLIITGEDDGIGIPDDEKERIFEHGFGKNTGIGLFLAREILSITGLSIRECGQEGKGARFEILVPAGKFKAFQKEGV